MPARHRRRLPPPPPGLSGPIPPGQPPSDIGGVFYSVGLTILLMIVTLGIWGIFWTYRTNEDLKRYNRDGLGGVLGVILLPRSQRRVDVHDPQRDRGGVPPRQPARARSARCWGLWFLLPIVGHLIWYLKVQRVLNEFWQSKGSPAT